MSSTIDNLSPFVPFATSPTASPDTRMFDHFIGQLIVAIRLMQAQQQAGAPSRFERGGREGLGLARPTSAWDAGGRTLPSVTGCGGGDPQAASRVGGGRCKSGHVDVAALLAQMIAQACPTQKAPADCKAPTDTTPAPTDCGPAPTPTDCGPAPTPTDCGPAPTDCPPTTPTDDCGVTPPTEGPAEPESPANKKVFIVGDLVKFGRSDGTVRGGLKQLLAAAEGKKQKGAVTNSTLSEEDAGKLRALLASEDPAVKSVLSKKVPGKKSLVIGEDGKLVATLNTRDQVMSNASLDVADHKNNRIDRSAGGQIDIEGTKYDVAGTELHSPIKIALDGKDAKLNGTNGFRIDLDGFTGKGGVSKTSGGLNGNEAWLVRDREGNGITKNGVVDGNDVYGDHNGQRKDGYDDLARDFARELKTDPKTGKRYLDLTAPGSRAGQELKLLDASGKLRPAREVLSRIDVDGTAADERDGRGNVITARSEVTYRDGNKATSADQWFAVR